MRDIDFWRNLYGSEWRAGKHRVERVEELLKRIHPTWIIKPNPMAKSTDHFGKKLPLNYEKGRPNLRIYDNGKLLAFCEVTGTYKYSEIGDKPLWIRPDKISWSKAHDSHKTMVFFVYPDKIFLVEDITELSKYPLEEKILKENVVELYYEVPQSADEVELFNYPVGNTIQEKLFGEINDQ